MTRKCILCKETNYRNTYSFFSAPKDPELRKKWQNAIAIKDYSVTDDTYVCSKHFHKDDIITHWVSGVPPHVISIKYKKCRLRPGAIPKRNCHLKENEVTQKHSDDSDVSIHCYSPFKPERMATLEQKEADFLIPRSKEKLEINCGKKYQISSYTFHNFLDFNYIPRRDSQDDMDFPENDLDNISYNNLRPVESANWNSNQVKQNTLACAKEKFTNSTNSINDMNLVQNQISKVSNLSNKDDTLTSENIEMSKHTLSKERSTNNNFNSEDDIYIENRIINNLNYDQQETYYPACNDIVKNEMLFEDLLEVCTEVLLPRGWSSLVTSKGHTTTIVYLYMGMTENGMPFAEKQVFIKSDMTLHCVAVNKEINPLIYNLVREGKHIKVQNLVDIEELIDEFDQRIVCQGLNDTQAFRKINCIKIAYKDGIKWRHVRCSLLVNNDSRRCTRCTSLSYALQHKSRNFFSLPYNCSVFTRKHSKIHSIYKKCRRLKNETTDMDL